jgi:Na+/phosphate symporter
LLEPLGRPKSSPELWGAGFGGVASVGSTLGGAVPVFGAARERRQHPRKSMSRFLIFRVDGAVLRVTFVARNVTFHLKQKVFKLWAARQML